jgi:hypothetical protein
MSKLKDMADWFSIEDKGRHGFSVYGWDIYPSNSVLAGQNRKSYIESFPTEEEARAAYPTAQEGTGKRDPGNTYSHLPGEDDPVPGGMYPDDY